MLERDSLTLFFFLKSITVQNDDQKEYQQALSENINNRLENAVEELREKHEKGTNEVDDPDRAPTGHVYRALQSQAAQKEKVRREQAEQSRIQEAEELAQVKRNVQRQFQNSLEDNDDDDGSLDDDEYDDLLEDDPALEAIRQKRMEEMRQNQIKHAENVARGHGQYRTIGQDDFLPECSGGSEWVAIHFFHKDFERCKILDHHIKIIAPRHMTCKFLRIDAEKAPFFVGKLQIKTLPTLLVFQDGKTVARLTGFEGLAVDPSEPDKWHTGRLQEWLAETGAIEYTVPPEEVRQEMERLGLTGKKSIWRGGVDGYDDDE